MTVDYRYLLERLDIFPGLFPHRGSASRLLYVMLNPSTADEHHDDATIRRCLGFAIRHGYANMAVVNLFAMRSTDPRRLREHALRELNIGPENDRTIVREAARADRIVAAWGTHGRFRGRDQAVLRLLAAHDVYCLGLSKHRGVPLHPLRLPVDTDLILYRRASKPCAPATT